MRESGCANGQIVPPATPLRPTPALSRGQAFVRQCGGCGALIYVPWPPTSQRLGACSACGRADWWPLSLPVGPFPAAGHEAEHQ